MKRVILVRHATAVKRNPKKEDFNRPVNKTGRKEARQMSKRLKEMKIRPDVFISSPAHRALETAEIFASELKRSVKKIRKMNELYSEMTPERFLDLLKGLDDDVDSAIIFGHDPLFTDFARFLVPGFDAEIPKAGVLGVQADAASWRDVKPEKVEKMYFFSPGDAKAAKERAREARKTLEAGIESGIVKAIGEFGIDTAPEVLEELRRASAKLAKHLAPRAANARPQTAATAEPDPSGKKRA